jgi:hypothetical protein
MAAFLHVLALAAAVAIQCGALRNEDEEKPNKTLHGPEAQVLGVTDSGYFVTSGLHVVEGPMKNVSGSRERHWTAKHHTSSSMLSIDEGVAAQPRRQKRGKAKRRDKQSGPNDKAKKDTPAQKEDAGKGNDDAAGKGKSDDASKSPDPEEQDHPKKLNPTRKDYA